MAEIHYLISDASKKVDVEAHVLRYWEEELELTIPRNEMGHRFYTDFHIRLFKQVKELKEKGYQLKAIKTALSKSLESDGKIIIPNEVLEEDVIVALKNNGVRGQAGETGLTNVDKQGATLEEAMSGEKMVQFRKIMNHIIGQAIEENSEKLSQDISLLVHDKMSKEMDYMLREADEKEDERFKQLDETLRSYQKGSKGSAEAAASKIPFLSFKKKKFGRNGNKM